MDCNGLLIKILDNGIEFDKHETDIYIRNNKENNKMIENFKFKSSIKTFNCEITGNRMYEIPFLLNKDILNSYVLIKKNGFFKAVRKKEILYHGSSETFKKFRISNGLLKTDISVLPEGTGIYMTKNKDVANAYGSNLYSVYVESAILDFTTKESIEKHFKLFLLLNNYEYLDLEIKETVEGIFNSKISIIGAMQEILSINDYMLDSVLGDHYYDVEYKILDDWENYLSTGVIAYNTNDIGIVYIAKNSDIISIKEVIKK